MKSCLKKLIESLAAELEWSPQFVQAVRWLTKMAVRLGAVCLFAYVMIGFLVVVYCVMPKPPKPPSGDQHPLCRDYFTPPLDQSSFGEGVVNGIMWPVDFYEALSVGIKDGLRKRGMQ